MSSPIGPVNEQYSTVSGSGPEPVNVAEYERYAKHSLPRNIHDYYASGSNDMITLRENRAAFSRLRIMPRVLVDVSKISTETTILGVKIASPICIAPSAMQKMAHPDGEIATAKAAAQHNTLMVLSTLSTTSLEEVAAAAPGAPRWLQVYVYSDRAVTLGLIRRAEAAGYIALAITVDTPVLGRREADVKNQFALPPHLKYGNFEALGDDHVNVAKSAGAQGSGLATYFAGLLDQTLNWEDIKWVRSVSKLKIVVKGIMTPEDALIAVEHGVDGIWVSNHGARQLDTTPATIEVLREIVTAVRGYSGSKGRGNNSNGDGSGSGKGSDTEVYLDGGIMRGTDVLKALSLGARAVFVGRPALWGLARNGQRGLEAVLRLLNDEFTMAMKLAGATSVKGLKPSLIRTALSLQSRL